MANRDEMTFEGELDRLLDADPFETFAISVTSGERFNISVPHLLVVGQSVATLIGAGARTVVIRKNQMVAIDATCGGR